METRISKVCRVCKKVTPRLTQHLNSEKCGQNCKRQILLENMSVDQEAKRAMSRAKNFTKKAVISREKLLEFSEGNHESMKALLRLCADRQIYVVGKEYGYTNSTSSQTESQEEEEDLSEQHVVQVHAVQGDMRFTDSSPDHISHTVEVDTSVLPTSNSQSPDIPAINNVTSVHKRKACAVSHSPSNRISVEIHAAQDLPPANRHSPDLPPINSVERNNKRKSTAADSNLRTLKCLAVKKFYK